LFALPAPSTPLLKRSSNWCFGCEFPLVWCLIVEVNHLVLLSTLSAVKSEIFHLSAYWLKKCGVSLHVWSFCVGSADCPLYAIFAGDPLIVFHFGSKFAEKNVGTNPPV
jgi:hypothetical protein